MRKNLVAYKLKNEDNLDHGKERGCSAGPVIQFGNVSLLMPKNVRKANMFEYHFYKYLYKM